MRLINPRLENLWFFCRDCAVEESPDFLAFSSRGDPRPRQSAPFNDGAENRRRSDIIVLENKKSKHTNEVVDVVVIVYGRRESSTKRILCLLCDPHC